MGDMIDRDAALAIAQSMNNGETAKAIARAIAALPAVTAQRYALDHRKGEMVHDQINGVWVFCGDLALGPQPAALEPQPAPQIVTAQPVRVCPECDIADCEAHRPAPDAAAMTPEVAQAYEKGLNDALGRIASIGYGKNEDVDAGHEEAFRAVQKHLTDWKAAALITEKPHDRA